MDARLRQKLDNYYLTKQKLKEEAVRLEGYGCTTDYAGIPLYDYDVMSRVNEIKVKIEKLDNFFDSLPAKAKHEYLALEQF